MSKATPLVLVWAGALMLAGCHHDHWGHRHADVDKVASDIRAQEAQMQTAYSQKNADALSAAYADSAVLGSPGAALARSAQERRKEIEGMIGDPNFKVDFASDVVDVAKSGDLAYSRGHYQLQMTDAASKQAASSSGTYITVWKPQSDGKWKAVEDFIIPGPAPAAK